MRILNKLKNLVISSRARSILLVYLLLPLSIVFYIVRISNDNYTIYQSNSSYLISRECKLLNQEIVNTLNHEIDAWSVSVLDSERTLIAALNSEKLFIPASNVKLFTTAFALDKLGSNFRLTTKLISRRDGILELWGEGDPDLSDVDIEAITKQASLLLKDRLAKNKQPIIILYEEPKTNWWSTSWHQSDRLYSYGSPITRLALVSNSTSTSINAPFEKLLNVLDSKIKLFDIEPILQKEDFTKIKLFQSLSDFFLGRKVIFEILSAPMVSLLSLANSESHNFTAEVLLRNAAGSWNPDLATNELSNWLLLKGIPASEFIFVDGSGLSRLNKVTTAGISSLLWHMDHHKYSAMFKSSMAILGVRGTLIDFDAQSSIKGNFFGKTGTLTGVRAVSGILNTKNNVRYISIISNNASDPNKTIGELLNIIYRYDQC